VSPALCSYITENLSPMEFAAVLLLDSKLRRVVAQMDGAIVGINGVTARLQIIRQQHCPNRDGGSSATS
jgi:hypothetical protein